MTDYHEYGLEDHPVRQPKHYMLGSWAGPLEVRHVREMLLKKMEGHTPVAIDYWSRAWEYLTRFMDKNGLEDLEKCQVYLGWLIQELKRGSVSTVHTQK